MASLGFLSSPTLRLWLFLDFINKMNENIKEPLLPSPYEAPPSHPHVPPSTWKYKGILLAILSVFCLHGQKLFARLAMDSSSLSPYQLIYCRCLIIFIIFILFPLFTRDLSYLTLKREVLVIVLLRAFVNTWSGLCLYIAMEYIPYSESVLLSELKPVFGSALAVLILHERLSIAELCALLLSVGAVYMYADPGGYLNGPRA